MNKFDFNQNKYIILYTDHNIDTISLVLKEKFNLTVVKLLLNFEKKNNSDIYSEIYSDTHIDELLINNAYCIIYLSKINRSDILINLLDKYNKLVIYNEDNIISDIILLNENNLENKLNDFKLLYDKLPPYKNNLILHKNIKLKYSKLSQKYEKEQIHMITVFKTTDIKILNVIQKKCIIENLHNKNVKQLIVLGHNLEEEFKDVMTNIGEKKIIFYENNNQVSYKDLLEISNKSFENKITCIIRSDIILPNQPELDDLEINLLENKNEIYAISRLERLINGNLTRSPRLNKILSCTEQDAWLFKSPLNINLRENKYLENIYLYDKYSELYFNQALKLNNYSIINNTIKYKIIRILFDNNIDNRLLLNTKNINIEHDIFLLPDNESIDKIPIDKLLKYFNINDKEIYAIKCDIFNKYLKNKIIDAIS